MPNAKPPAAKPGILDIRPYVGGKSDAAAAATRTVKLSSNENPWGPSPRAIAAYESAAKHLHRYPDGGHLALRRAIARAQDLPEAQLICGAGSDELIGLLVHAYAGAGDEVLYSAHGFLMYRIYALASSATPVSAPERALHADVDALLAAVTPRTRIVFLANPNNPTGTVLPFKEIHRLRDGLPEDAILALDGAYAEYIDDPGYEDGRSLVAQGTNTVVLHTFSKIYGLPALRLGWAYAPAAIIDVLNRIRGPFNVSAPALAAGLAAMEDQAYVLEMRAHNQSARAQLSAAIARLGYAVVPSDANFILVKFGSEVAAVNAHLLERGVIVREVSAYGLPEYLRITVGTPEENALLLHALEQYVHSRAA